MDIVGFKNDLLDLLRTIQDNINAIFKPDYQIYGLTIIQVRILMEIYMYKNQTIGDLGKLMGMSSGNISALCKKLEKMGYVKRIRDEIDERVVKVNLTDNGFDIMVKIEGVVKSKYGSLIEQMSEKSLNELIDGLQKLNELLLNLRDIKIDE